MNEWKTTDGCEFVVTIPQGYTATFFMNTFVAVHPEKPPIRLNGTEWEKITPDLEDDLGAGFKINVGSILLPQPPKQD